MARRDRKCYLCGENYKYCPTCSDDKMKPYWMSDFHSEACKDIFEICTNFNLGKMPKHEAKAALEQYDLSNKANFKAFAQRDLENIFKSDEEPKAKRVKKAEMPIFDESTYEVVTQEE